MHVCCMINMTVQIGNEADYGKEWGSFVISTRFSIDMKNERADGGRSR